MKRDYARQFLEQGLAELHQARQHLHLMITLEPKPPRFLPTAASKSRWWMKFAAGRRRTSSRFYPGIDHSLDPLAAGAGQGRLAANKRRAFNHRNHGPRRNISMAAKWPSIILAICEIRGENLMS